MNQKKDPKEKGGVMPLLLTPWQRALLDQKMHLVEKRVAYWERRFEGLDNLEDFLTAGKIGLMEAVHKADPARISEFDGYAIANIDGRILDLIRCASRIRHVERAARRAGAQLWGTVTIEYNTLHDGDKKLEEMLLAFAGDLVTAGCVAGVTAGGAAQGEEESAESESHAADAVVVREALAAVPEDLRVVVVAVVVQGKTRRKVEEELGISYNTVRRRLERGIRRLRAELEARMARDEEPSDATKRRK